MSPLVVVITSEQLARLQALCESSEFTVDQQIGALIDLDWEEWQDALTPGPSRSTRFARFEAAETAEREAFIANATDDEAGASGDVRIALSETIRGVRLFRGDSTSQLTHDGRKADPELWYLEPVDYDGDVLWSKGYSSRAEAYHAAGLSWVSE